MPLCEATCSPAGQALRRLGMGEARGAAAAPIRPDASKGPRQVAGQPSGQCASSSARGCRRAGHTTATTSEAGVDQPGPGRRRPVARWTSASLACWDRRRPAGANSGDRNAGRWTGAQLNWRRVRPPAGYAPGYGRALEEARQMAEGPSAVEATRPDSPQHHGRDELGRTGRDTFSMFSQCRSSC